MGLARNVANLIWPSAVQLDPEQRKTTAHAQWSMSQERQFMEELVYKRLTLFLTVSGALIAGAINLRDSPWIATAVLLAGTILCWILQQTVHRAQIKLDIILQILFADTTHPTGRIEELYNDKNRVRFVGVVVPSGVCLILTGFTLVEAVIAVGTVWPLHR